MPKSPFAPLSEIGVGGHGVNEWRKSFFNFRPPPFSPLKFKKVFRNDIDSVKVTDFATISLVQREMHGYFISKDRT